MGKWRNQIHREIFSLCKNSRALNLLAPSEQGRTSCENAKIAGTLIDLGAPGYTHEEAALFEGANAPVDIDDNLALYNKRQRGRDTESDRNEESE